MCLGSGWVFGLLVKFRLATAILFNRFVPKTQAILVKKTLSQVRPFMFSMGPTGKDVCRGEAISASKSLQTS